MTLQELESLLREHDDGVLRSGQHSEGREFCALEFESKVRGRAWSDAPVTLPDLRPLNDAPWSSDAARTAALLPVMVALWDWSLWTSERHIAWASRVAIDIVREIIGELPSIGDVAKIQCKEATTIEAAVAGAAEAARAAARAAAREASAAWAAEAAAWAAASAAWAAAAAARAAAEAVAGAAEAAAEKVLVIACRIWIRAAEETA